jgi:hypothetical protein
VNARARYAPAASLLALILASCTDDGIVGTRAAQTTDDCEPSCQGDELCHPELEVCVACLETSDCAGEPGTVVCDPTTNDCVPCADDDPDDVFDDDDDCDLDEVDGSSPDDDNDDDPSP